MSACGPCTAWPGREELRMLSAIAATLIDETRVRSESHVSFRGFRIDAMRLARAQENDFVMRVELVVRLAGHTINREVAEILPLCFD